MRRTASLLLLIPLLLCSSVPIAAADACVVDPLTGTLVCSASGIIPGIDPPPARDEPPPLRYLHLQVDPVIGDCYSWSAVPGGLDSWDGANDAAILAIIAANPECPAAAPVSAEDIAWSVFRSWTLLAPAAEMEPPDNGITGLPTYLAASAPLPLTHTEVLPDGRVLDVRATIAVLEVDWGDGTESTHDATEATPHPTGTVTHTYATKTCTAEYRASHPRGHLCHPTLDAYPIVAVYRWAGEWNVGGGWNLLEVVDRATALTYDVDEIIGVLLP